MKTENVGVVEEQVTLNVTVHQETRVAKDRGKGSQRGRINFQRHNADNENRESWSCGGTGHFERDSPSRNQGGKRQQNNYGSTSKNVDDLERLFVMQHMMNTMSTNASKRDNNVWDDTAHPIAHTRNVPLSLQDGNVKYLADVLHVPNITKNLVSVAQMVEQGLQVRLNADGIYVEEYKKNGKLIAQGKKVGKMFTLDVNIPEVNAVMFAHGSSIVVDIEIWHKRIGHANVQKLKTMQSEELVTCLSVFKVADMQKVYEACQFRKQAKASFPHDKHVSSNVLELMH
ncbi:hypothetical protein L7F22_045255 [Adiantum nelumboides]|nr:hypothetical protein [Adiantum nelumboides]